MYKRVSCLCVYTCVFVCVCVHTLVHPIPVYSIIQYKELNPPPPPDRLATDDELFLDFVHGLLTVDPTKRLTARTVPDMLFVCFFWLIFCMDSSL
jgi:serine/threonine protein kinase